MIINFPIKKTLFPVPFKVYSPFDLQVSHNAAPKRKRKHSQIREHHFQQHKQHGGIDKYPVSIKESKSDFLTKPICPICHECAPQKNKIVSTFRICPELPHLCRIRGSATELRITMTRAKVGRCVVSPRATYRSWKE